MIKWSKNKRSDTVAPPQKIILKERTIMQKYLNPEIEILQIEVTDVITTSGPEITDPNETPGVSVL